MTRFGPDQPRHIAVVKDHQLGASAVVGCEPQPIFTHYLRAVPDDVAFALVNGDRLLDEDVTGVLVPRISTAEVGFVTALIGFIVVTACVVAGHLMWRLAEWLLS